MLIKNIALITSLTVSAVTASGAFTQANAAIFNVGGTNYDITTVSTTFNTSSSLLQSQPWWGSETLATTFATTVAGSFGFPNFGSFGPLFAWADSGGPNINAVVFFSTLGIRSSLRDRSVTFTYATATLANPTPVPESSSILGLGLIGLLGVVTRLKQPKQS